MLGRISKWRALLRLQAYNTIWAFPSIQADLWYFIGPAKSMPMTSKAVEPSVLSPESNPGGGEESACAWKRLHPSSFWWTSSLVVEGAVPSIACGYRPLWEPRLHVVCDNVIFVPASHLNSMQSNGAIQPTADRCQGKATQSIMYVISKFATICPATSSSLSIVRLCLCCHQSLHCPGWLTHYGIDGSSDTTPTSISKAVKLHTFNSLIMGC